MLNLVELPTPLAVVDLDILEANIMRMASRAAAAGVALRPHVKAHRSTWIAGLQRAAGARGITVARLGEAEVFADAGFDDLLLAFPVVGPINLKRLTALREKTSVAVALDDAGVAAALGRSVGSSVRLPVFVEVDTGLGRCGQLPGGPTIRLVREIAGLPGIDMRGLLTHAGHAYSAKSWDELRQFAFREAADLVGTADAIHRDGFDLPEISIGSTPTAAFIEEVAQLYREVTEIRPGAYVFNDVDQLGLGIAAEADCALTVHATIISRPALDRAVADAGSKVLGSDPTHGPGFGRVRGHPEVTIGFLNEEHAVISGHDLRSLRVGDRIEIIPNHACLVPNLVGSLVAVRQGRIQQTIPVDARGRSQ